MAELPAPRSTRRALDDAALRRVRRRLASAAQAPWLHREAARRMAERLPIILQSPRTVLDWDAVASGSAEALHSACPRAEIVPVLTDVDVPPLPQAQPAWWSPQRWRGLAAARSARPAAALPAAAGDLLWSNMGLHWCVDPQAEMRRWHEVLAVDGFVMFSTLGPGTLASLRSLYAERGWHSPHAPFVDMHDLGDMLVGAGFADPVMDQETLTLSWADGASLLAELRAWGGNIDPGRHAGLRTPRWRDALLAALSEAPDVRPSMCFEVVYGHAFRPRPRPRLAAETTVGLQDMRSILRR